MNRKYVRYLKCSHLSLGMPGYEFFGEDAPTYGLLIHGRTTSNVGDGDSSLGGRGPFQHLGCAEGEPPLLLTMNCLNGYFHFPYFNALAEELLQAEDKGAIRVFSPGGLSLNDHAHVFHIALLEELLEGGHARLGDAVLAAQAAYAEAGALPEMLTIYHLFGDPAPRIESAQ